MLRAMTYRLCQQEIATAVQACTRGALPNEGGLVLLAGSPEDAPIKSIWQPLWAGTVHEQATWATLPTTRCLYDLVVFLNPPEEYLAALHQLVRPDGLALLVVPRPWPLGVPDTEWQHGTPLIIWRQILRNHGLKLISRTHIGGKTGCAGVLAVNPLRGGTKVLARGKSGKVELRPAGVVS